MTRWTARDQQGAARAAVRRRDRVSPRDWPFPRSALDGAHVRRVRRLDPDLPLPSYAHPGDAGADLRAATDVTLAPGERTLVPTGVALAIPDGWVGLVHPRSGLAAKHGISIVNAPGTVDSGYRGEILVNLVNLDPRDRLHRASRRPHRPAGGPAGGAGGVPSRLIRSKPPRGVTLDMVPVVASATTPRQRRTDSPVGIFRRGKNSDPADAVDLDGVDGGRLRRRRLDAGRRPRTTTPPTQADRATTPSDGRRRRRGHGRRRAGPFDAAEVDGRRRPARPGRAAHHGRPRHGAAPRDRRGGQPGRRRHCGHR